MKSVPSEIGGSTRTSHRIRNKAWVQSPEPGSAPDTFFHLHLQGSPRRLDLLAYNPPVTAATSSARTCLRPAKFQHPRRTHDVQKVDVHNERWRSHHSPAHAR